MKRKTLLLLMLLTLGAAGAMKAQTFSGGNGTSSSPYEIASTNDWDYLVSNISTYQSSYFKMTANVGTVTTMVGTSDYPFKGTFDGNGKTLTVNISGGNSDGSAPFRYISGATIKNLEVSGTVTASAHHTSGLVGYADNSNLGYANSPVNVYNYITNCLVHTNVTNNSNYIGGIIGHNKCARTTIEGCVYDGKLTSSGYKGGMMGWSDRSTLTVTNSYFGGSVSTTSNFSPIGCKTQTYSGYNVTMVLTFSNFYYNTDAGSFSNNVYNAMYNATPTGSAKHAYTITGGTDVDVARSGNYTSYSCSGITAYSAGIVYGGDIIAGNGDEVALTLNYTGSGILEGFTTTPSATLSGSGTSYTLTMPSSDVTISATTSAPTYVLHDSDNTYMTWAEFAQNVLNGGGSAYSGKTVYLDYDVTVTEPIGIQNAASGNGDHFFAGTFDGQGHTITLNMTATRTMYGLFAVLNGTTVQNLIIDGSISNTNYQQIGGLAGYTLGTCTITNCLSNVSISSSKSDDICGGFIAEMGGNSKVTFEGCAFTGTLTAQNNCGGFVGFFNTGSDSWDNGSTLSINNSIFASANSTATSHCGNFTYINYNRNLTIDNSYYTTSFGTSQGKQAYTVTYDTERNVTVAMNGTSTNYNVSGITAYSDNKGLVYNGTIIAGSGDNVSLTLNGGGGANNNRYYALPSGTTLNTSTGVLTMPANDVTITNARRFADSGQWSYYSYWRPQQVPESDEDVIIEGSVYISSNDVAKIHNIEISGSGSIIINEGGQLQHCNEGVVATMGKSIVGYGTSTGKDHFYMMALPFTTFAIAGSPLVTSGAYDLYKFDGLQPQAEWVNYEQSNNTHPFTTIQNGEGFLYANTNTQTSFMYLKGTLVPSNQSKYFPLVYNTDTPFGAWNLVGNPFACNATSSITDYYVIGGQNDDEVEPSSGVIKPMQGIFVKASATTSSVTFTPTTENSNNNTSSSVNLILKLADTRDAKVIDLARVRFGEGEGLEKFQLNPDHTKLYIPQSDKDYAVVHTQAEGELPLNFKVENNGRYTLSADLIDVEMDYLHLIDNMTGADIDLLATPTYTFDARTTDYASRFRLVFAATGIEENGASTGSATFAYYNGSEWNIANNGEATLQVIDIMGRVLSSQVINGNTSINLNQSAGVYMLRLVDGNSVRTQKVIVK